MNIEPDSISFYQFHLTEKISNSFQNWLPKIFAEKFAFDSIRSIGTVVTSEIISNKSKMWSNLAENLILVTLSPKHGGGPIRSALSYEPDGLFKKFRGFYITLCKEYIKQRVSQKPVLQPFGVAFLDVEGTRTVKHQSEYRSPHIHAVLLLNCKNSDDFYRKFRFSNGVYHGEYGGYKVHMEKVQPSEDDVRTVLTYASKFVNTKFADRRLIKSFEFFPTLEANRYPFYKANDKLKHYI